MPDDSQKKSDARDGQDRTVERASINSDTVTDSQTGAQGKASIEQSRTNIHNGSAGGSDISITIESVKEDGTKHIASRTSGLTEKDLKSNKPIGGFTQTSRADGGISLQGVIPDPETHEVLKHYRPPEMQKPEQPASLEWLASELQEPHIVEKLKQNWEYTQFNKSSQRVLDALLKSGTSWAAELRTIGRDGHVVVVDGLSETGNVIIRDPLRVRKYEMTQADFAEFWSGYAVYQKNIFEGLK